MLCNIHSWRDVQYEFDEIKNKAVYNAMMKKKCTRCGSGVIDEMAKQRTASARHVSACTFVSQVKDARIETLPPRAKPTFRTFSIDMSRVPLFVR